MSLNIANTDRLISHLEGLPEERFNIAFIMETHSCGSVGCIAGHLNMLVGEYTEPGDFLNIPPECAGVLIMPRGYYNDRAGNKKYPLSRAIRTLKHMRAEFLRTGQVVVDWDAPEPAARKDWAAPKVSEQKLPAEITKLLIPTVRAEVL